MRYMKQILILLCAALLVLAVSLPAFAADKVAEPVKIGLTLGLTGKYAEISDFQMKAFKLWESDVNKSGGILGRNVKLIVYDDKSDIETARSLYEQLITNDKVDLFFAPYSSELTEAVLPITEKYGYPVITSGASADKIWQKGYKYCFGLYAPASKYVIGFLEIVKKSGLDEVSIIYADDSFSKGIANGTKQWAEKFGLKVPLFTEFKKGTKDFDEILKKAKELNTKALIVCGHFDESVNVRLAFKDIKWTPKFYYASVGPVLQTYYEKLGTDANYTFSTSMWEPHGKLLGSRGFYEKFKATYGKEPSYQAANAYAAGEIIARVTKKVGSLDKDKIRDILSIIDTTTIIGRYSVDKAGTPIKHSPLIIQWQNGKKVIVSPEELATGKPMFK